MPLLGVGLEVSEQFQALRQGFQPFIDGHPASIILLSAATCQATCASLSGCRSTIAASRLMHDSYSDRSASTGLIDAARRAGM
jgi:hypothetical protein